MIGAPVDVVYAYRLDFSNLPDYNPDILECVLRDGEGPPGVGSVYDFKLRFPLGIVCAGSAEIVDLDPPRRIEITLDTVIRAREICRLESRGADATHAEFDIDVATPGGPLARVLDAAFIMPMTRRQARRELTLLDRTLRE